MKKQHQKILIVAPSWVGDMVMAQSLFITLKNQYPDCQIDVLAPATTLPLLTRMPEISQAILQPSTRGKLALFDRIRLGNKLVNKDYDQAIVLPNSWKSALPVFFAKIPIRTGYIGECRWGLLNDARQLNKQQLTMTVQRFVALAHPKSMTQSPLCPEPALLVEPAQQQRVQKQFALSITSRILALCPGAEYGPAKRWPATHFAELARNSLTQGWQVWLFGSEKDKPEAELINQATDNACADFTGKTTLTEAVDLLSLADTIVSNDSGLMHVAAALNKPVVAIYGSSDPDFTPPLNRHAQIVSLNLDCAPCFQRSCPLGHMQCLAGIDPKHISQLIATTSIVS